MLVERKKLHFIVTFKKKNYKFAPAKNNLKPDMALKSVFIPLFALVLIQSCASKKDILYFQDSQTYNENTLNYESHTLQPNDIVKITVGALVPELALPYNKITNDG